MQFPLLGRRRFVAAALSTAAFGRAEARAAPAHPGYRVVFADDFDDGDVGRINEHGVGRGAIGWRSRYRHDRWTAINQEKQIYVDPDFAGTAARPLDLQPFAMRDGVLRISAMPAPAAAAPHLKGFRYISGCITTEYTHWQTYGWFEMRARLPLGRGFWPAFWLMPKRPGWPPEIDVFEGSGLRRDSVYAGVLGAELDGRKDFLPVADVSHFHVYACDWTPRHIAFFIDGREMMRQANVIDEPMYMLANLALGSHDPGWIPDPDHTTPFPGVFEIDYVLAYAIDGVGGVG